MSAIKILLVVFCLCSLSAYSQTDTITVLSWNVFLRPAAMQDKQLERTSGIADFIQDQNCEVVVLQEVFHRKARKKLVQDLKADYPYWTGYGRTSFFGVPSGVAILSKKPITKTRYRYFKKAIGSDVLAKKGVIRSRIKFYNTRIDIYGTHMQAGSGSKRRKIRQKQLDLIQDFINAEDSIIDIIAGDFNISAAKPAADSIEIKLNTQLPKINGKHHYTANFSDHELNNAKGTPKWIDFILMRKTRKAYIAETRIYEPKNDSLSLGNRLSDHNPIISTIILR